MAKSIPADGLEQFRRQVLGAADIDGPDIERAGFCLGRGDEVAERLVGRVGAGREDEIEKSQAGNRLEIFQRIERQFLEQRDADRGAVGQQRQRRAVGRRRDHRPRRGDAAGAGLVLDVEALPELVGELFRDDARGDIGDAAGRERQHDANGLVGVFGFALATEAANTARRYCRENTRGGAIDKCHDCSCFH